MGFLSMFGARKSSRTTPEKKSASYEQGIYYDILGQMRAGSAMSEQRAMQISAVSACVKLISETISSLPFDVVEQKGERRAKVTDHPLTDTLSHAPNPWQDGFQFLEQQMVGQLLRGNSYAFKNISSSGKKIELIPIKPDLVEVKQRDDFTLLFRVRGGNGQVREYTQNEIAYWRGLSLDGITGISVLKHASSALNLSHAAQEFGQKFMENGLQPSVALVRPVGSGSLSDLAFDRLKKQLDELSGSENAGKRLILEDGMEPKQMSVTAEDAQFLDTRKFQVIDVCRIFGVPPSLIGATETTPYNTVEALAIAFVKHCIRPWVVRLERQIKRDLLASEKNLYPSFNLDALLRGDLKTRYESYAIGKRSGFLTDNEIREKEDKPPVENGDRRYVEANLIPVDRVDDWINSKGPTQATAPSGA